MRVDDYLLSYSDGSVTYEQTFCASGLSKHEEELEKILFKGDLISNFGIEVDIKKISIRKM